MTNVDRYGTNARKEIKIKSFCELVMEQLKDNVLRILVVSALAALVLGISKEGWKTVS